MRFTAIRGHGLNFSWWLQRRWCHGRPPQAEPVAGRVAPTHVFGVLVTAGSWFGQMPNPSHPSLMGTGKREPAAARRAQPRAAG